MLTPQRPTAVLLDIDGTLLDSNEAHTHAWAEVLRRHGRPVAYEALRGLIGMGGDKLLAELLQIDAASALGRTLSRERRELFVQQLLPALRPTNGARALVQRLVDDGLQPVVATSSSAEELPGLLRQAGVADLLHAAVTCDEADHSKPDPDIVQAALRKAGVAAGAAVMVGDTPFDVQAAAAAGVATVALRCGGWWDAASFADAAAVFDDPADLLRRWSASPFTAERQRSGAAPPAATAARPRIGCLAWGSLVWKRGPLPLASPWLADGPPLPIEFCRVADDGELSTALCPGAHRMPTRWALLDVASVDAARELLRQREQIDVEQPQCVGSVPVGAARPMPPHADEIAAWARAKRLDAVVWTALPPRFDGDNGRVPSAAEAVDYLGRLQGETRRHAEHYVRHFDAEIDTHHRRAITAALGWTAAGADDSR